MDHLQDSVEARTTRLAPSPTGDLHLGNVRTFLLNWSLARNLGWTVLLRHEDLDVKRASPERIDLIERSMGRLGLDWDGRAVRQSDDLQPYLGAMDVLAKAGKVYRSTLSRRDVRDALNAPHAGGELRFPPELRPANQSDWGFHGAEHGHRFAMPSGDETIDDRILGDRTFDPGREVGDPIVWTRDGRPAYQLAVVVDDLRHGITDVVRGEDLLSSAARQRVLTRAMERDRDTRWWHLPLVRDGDGRRLAKRDGDRGLAEYLSAGVPCDNIIGLLAYRSGLQETLRPMALDHFRRSIEPETLRSLARREREQPCRLRDTDHDWLVSCRP